MATDSTNISEVTQFQLYLTGCLGFIKEKTQMEVEENKRKKTKEKERKRQRTERLQNT